MVYLMQRRIKARIHMSTSKEQGKDLTSCQVTLSPSDGLEGQFVYQQMRLDGLSTLELSEWLYLFKVRGKNANHVTCNDLKQTPLSKMAVRPSRAV